MIHLDAFARRNAARRGLSSQLVGRICLVRRPAPQDPARTRMCGAILTHGALVCRACADRLHHQEMPDAQDPQALADVAQGLPAGMALPHLEGAPPSHGGPPDDTSPSET